ncbi:MAG: hypothetical protein PWP23_122 [Candidatus Sumerlaeota bacterium]|nr:hypothetical protein [Candidatus Sumerlaeota bacterium]
MSLSKLGRTPTDLNYKVEHLGIPGSKRPALFYQDKRTLPTAERGEGIYIYDTEGKRYLDGCSGAIAANIGHGNKRVNERAVEQIGKIAFAYRTQFETEPANELAALLVHLSPEELNRVFFVNSGSEAVETAIKLARQYWWAQGKTGKQLVVSRRPSYHGATLGALSCTDYAPLNIPFRPMLLPFLKVSAPYCYHCPLYKEYPSCELACAYELERVIRVNGAENIAAFITEPIGGATTGGAVPPDEWFPIIERICHEHEILLIVDDVLTGCGRTGTFYGFEHWDVVPDIVAISKGLSGGYTPIGAVVASEEIVQPVLESGGFMHGHTYAGNPLSTAIACEVVKVILDDGLMENAREMGAYLHECLRELMNEFSVIGDIRGRGLLAGVEFVRDRYKREPFPAKWFVALEITEFARDHGLLIYPRRSLYGLSGDHVLISPPLIIDKAGVDEIIEKFTLALRDLTALVERHLEPEKPGVAYATIDRSHVDENIREFDAEEFEHLEADGEVNVTGNFEGSAMEVKGADIYADYEVDEYARLHHPDSTDGKGE